MMAFGGLLLLVAVTPASVVPPSFTSALRFRQVDLALFGLTLVVLGLVLLTIAR
jgi:hypothetical protein